MSETENAKDGDESHFESNDEDYANNDYLDASLENEEDEEEKGTTEELAPISALPPQLNVRDEIGQMEVSASPAFQCLDQASL